MTLGNDKTLKSLRLSLEIGRVKNPNKNPVAEKAIIELEEERLKQEPTGGPVSQLGLVIAVARLNSRIHYSGLSARELWTQVILLLNNFPFQTGKTSSFNIRYVN